MRSNARYRSRACKPDCDHRNGRNRRVSSQGILTNMPTETNIPKDTVILCYKWHSNHLNCYTIDAPRALTKEERALLVDFFAAMQATSAKPPEEIAGYSLVATGITDGSIPYAQYRKPPPIETKSVLKSGG